MFFPITVESMLTKSRFWKHSVPKQSILWKTERKNSVKNLRITFFYNSWAPLDKTCQIILLTFHRRVFLSHQKQKTKEVRLKRFWHYGIHPCRKWLQRISTADFFNSVKRIRRDFLAVSSSFIYTTRIRECVQNRHFGIRDSTVLKNVRQVFFANFLTYVFQNRDSLGKKPRICECVQNPSKR